jgi:DNA end-binding protein Ku
MAVTARSVWTGYIQVSLVSVPVRAYNASAAGDATIAFHQLHAECHNRVKYQKTCPLHGELREDEIVRGYQFAKDQYVVVDPAEVRKLRPQSDKSIRIEAFIRPDEVDVRFHAGRTQYLAPDGGHGALEQHVGLEGWGEAGRAAFSKIILSGREQLVLLRPVDNLLAMTFLSYASELKPIEAFLTEARPCRWRRTRWTPCGSSRTRWRSRTSTWPRTPTTTKTGCGSSSRRR